MVHLVGVTNALGKIKMTHLKSWHSPWKIPENFWKRRIHRNAAYTREGGRTGGVTGVTVLLHSLLPIKTWRNHTPRSFCRVQRMPQILQLFDMVNVIKNAYLCRRKPIETVVRE